MKFSKLSFLKEQDEEPECIIRVLKPCSDKQLLLSVVNIDGELVKHYLLQIDANIPLCPFETMKVEGYTGEQFVMHVKNPYSIQYKFILVSSVPWITFSQKSLIIDSNRKAKVICRL